MRYEYEKIGPNSALNHTTTNLIFWYKVVYVKLDDKTFTVPIPHSLNAYEFKNQMMQQINKNLLNLEKG